MTGFTMTCVRGTYALAPISYVFFLFRGGSHIAMNRTLHTARKGLEAGLAWIGSGSISRKAIKNQIKPIILYTNGATLHARRMVLQSHNASKISHALILKTSQRENRPLGKDVTLTGSGISSVYEGLRKQPKARFLKKVQRYENKQVLYFLKQNFVTWFSYLKDFIRNCILCYWREDMAEREMFVTQRCPD